MARQDHLIYTHIHTFTLSFFSHDLVNRMYIYASLKMDILIGGLP